MTPPKSNADRIREFHAGMGVNFPRRPTVPDPDVLALRRTLIGEEYAEVTAAFTQLQDAGETATTELAHLIHELADLLYVTYGAILACGVDADEVFAEVHRANMEKLDGPRRADGKLLKPPDWQPADVQGIVERQRRR